MAQKINYPYTYMAADHRPSLGEQGQTHLLTSLGEL
jgi:hypothetical protein